MGLKLHNQPQGKVEYADDGSDWPLISGQVQWSNNTPDDWHTHCEFATAGKLPGFPIWAELGNQIITVPVTIQVREVAGLSGSVTLVWGEYANHMQFPVIMDTPGPYKSNGPGIVTVYTGHANINIADAANVDTTGQVPKHGWTGVSIKSRTILTNGDQFDSETNVGVFSVVDTSIPESAINEAGIPLQAKAVNVLIAGATNPDIYGIHLVEIKDQSIPIVAPFSSPTFERVWGYNYGQDSQIPDQGFTYSATLDENAHLIPPIPGVPIQTQGFGNGGNFDTLDPLAFSKNPPLPGNSPNEHVIILAWDGPIPKGGFIDSRGQLQPGGVDLRSILKVIIFIGPDPQPAPPLTLLPVPQVVGLTQADAEKLIVSSGFRVGNVGQNIAPSVFPPGIVWTQNPSADPQPLPPQTLINIGVAIGGPPPVMVNVPNIVGMTQQNATTTLNGSSLAVGTVTNTNDPVIPKGIIISQNPQAGTPVPIGTTVSFVVSLGPVAPPTDITLGTIVKDTTGNVIVKDVHGNSLILLP